MLDQLIDPDTERDKVDLIPVLRDACTFEIDEAKVPCAIVRRLRLLANPNSTADGGRAPPTSWGQDFFGDASPGSSFFR